MKRCQVINVGIKVGFENHEPMSLKLLTKICLNVLSTEMYEHLKYTNTERRRENCVILWLRFELQFV